MSCNHRNYITEYKIQRGWVLNPNRLDKISHVRRQCYDCEWTSFATKVPEPIDPGSLQ